MNQATNVLRILAIIINAILCILLTLTMIVIGSDGGYLILMSLVVLTGVLNIVILCCVGRLIGGGVGIVSICLASVLNVCSLLGVIAGLYQYGMPGDALFNMAVIAWLIFPLITLPTLFIVRAQMKKGIKPNTLTCPNCGTEIQR